MPVQCLCNLWSRTQDNLKQTLLSFQTLGTLQWNRPFCIGCTFHTTENAEVYIESNNRTTKHLIMQDL